MVIELLINGLVNNLKIADYEFIKSAAIEINGEVEQGEVPVFFNKKEKNHGQMVVGNTKEVFNYYHNLGWDYLVLPAIFSGKCYLEINKQTPEEIAKQYERRPVLFQD